MSFLQRVAFDRSHADLGAWPWTIPALAGDSEFEFESPVTFFVGENGTGKSTVLEAIAVACGCPEQGGSSNRWMKGPERGTALASLTVPQFRSKPVGGAFFLRAESFFNLASAAENATEGGTYDATQLLASFGWRSPHSLSHGQAFVDLFRGRMGASSIWFMDEPEAPLSFRSQLTLLVEIENLSHAGAQFIIATHSPVLTAYPEADIYEFSERGVERTEWSELDLVRDARTFLNEPDAFFRHLFD